MASLPKPLVTPEEYLERERCAETKSEYYDGEMFAMAGVSRKHDAIWSQLYLLIGTHLRGSKCRVHSPDMRVLVLSSGLYTYPDLSVGCGEEKFADSQVDTLTNPILLVEILSPSTESRDRGYKANLYRRIPSLRELLLISQEAYEVELHRRQNDSLWSVIGATGLDASIELTSIGYTLHLRELYELVTAS